MSDRASVFAGFGDILTELCCFYVVVGRMIMNARTWGLPLWALFLPVLLSLTVFSLLLKKPRSVPVLAVTTVLLMGGSMAFWVVVSATPLRFGYGFWMLAGVGIAVGRSLHTVLRRVELSDHLAHVDVLFIVLLALLLIRSSDLMDISVGTVLTALCVLPVEIASAVGLRMTERGSPGAREVTRACLISLGTFVGVLLLSFGLSALLSGSGDLTDAVLRGVERFFVGIGKGLEGFFRRLAMLAAVEETYEALPTEEMASVAALEQSASGGGGGSSLWPLAIGLGILLLGLGVAAVLLLRRTRLGGETTVRIDAAGAETCGDRGLFARLWRQWRAALAFRAECFRKRDTAEALFLALERRGKRKKCPRAAGETMRQYTDRMAPSGALTPLADALDRRCYGPRPVSLSPGECRTLRRAIRRAGPSARK